MHNLCLTIGYYLSGLGYLLVLVGIVFLIVGYARSFQHAPNHPTNSPDRPVILVSNSRHGRDVSRSSEQ